ncbi:MAG: DUF4091 domain-containing protein [Sphingobacteriales bacterium]|nr:DUF4091 domain-containing protein [Sphingobacteriales bacterium]
MKKQTSTFYICCTPAKPNTFIFSPPVEGRWLGWYAFAKGYDGLLRWAYDAWMADPVRDARHVYWPAGDAFMVYPGAASSIRFEKMREGIADFEKLKIIGDKVNHSGSAEIKKHWQKLLQHLQSFIEEKKFDKEILEEQLQKALQLLDEMSVQVNNK